MPMRGALLAAAAVVVAGCLTPLAPTEDALTGSASSAYGPVVAIVDAGFDPYHERFRLAAAKDGEMAQRVAELGIRRSLLPSFGEAPHEAAQRDLSLWQSVVRGELYWIAGTPVIGAAFHRNPDFFGQPPPVPIVGGGSRHGTAVASRVLNASPGAILVFLHAAGGGVGERSDEGGYQDVSPSTLDALRFAAEQPWIDVISVSMGTPGNSPDAGPVLRDQQELFELTRLAAESGKIVVFGAGNTGAPPMGSPWAGPPWVVAVGGVESRKGADQPAASKLPDLVANYTVFEAEAGTLNASAEHRGTSYTAPAVAGHFANAIAALRNAAGLTSPRLDGGPFVPAGALGPGSGAIGAREVRAAFNASGTYVDPSAWDADARPPPASLGGALDWALNRTLPVAPALPAAQMGWGFVDAAEERDAIARLLAFARTGDRAALDPPPEKAADAAFLRAAFAAREAYWRAKAG